LLAVAAALRRRSVRVGAVWVGSAGLAVGRGLLRVTIRGGDAWRGPRVGTTSLLHRRARGGIVAAGGRRTGRGRHGSGRQRRLILWEAPVLRRPTTPNRSRSRLRRRAVAAARGPRRRVLCTPLVSGAAANAAGALKVYTRDRVPPAAPALSGCRQQEQKRHPREHCEWRVEGCGMEAPIKTNLPGLRFCLPRFSRTRQNYWPGATGPHWGTLRNGSQPNTALFNPQRVVHFFLTSPCQGAEHR